MSLKNFSRGGEDEIKKSAAGPSEKKSGFSGSTIFDSYLTEEEKRWFTKQIAKETYTITTADRLCKMTLKEGLTLLGRVSKIKDYELVVSLPGGFLGYVENTDVSQSYRRLLQSTASRIENEYYPLSELFKPGDYVTCYVKEVRKVYSDDWTCAVSLEPQLINLNIRPNNLVKGFKIICSVKSVEDNGYVVDTGILNVTAFLATENVEKGKKYLPNIQLLCTVKDVKTVDHATFVQLSTKKKNLISVDNYNLESMNVLTPGTKFSLRVEKLGFNYLSVYLGKINASIHQTYLKHPLSTYKLNMNVTGTLLYTNNGMAFFSELDDTFLEKENLRVGEIIKAKVLYKEANGVILQLSESGHRGYIAYRKTKVPLEKIKTVFKEGSVHKCRILRYNYLDHLYVCTTDEWILKEKYFTLFDVKIGDITTVLIEDFATNNIFVLFGHLYGTVSKIHLSDNGLYNGLKLKRFDKVEARVLNNNPVEFTLKRSLVKSKLPVLKDYSEAKCGLRYHGTIISINKKGILVKFYGKTVKGWVPHTTLNSDTRDMNWNFCIGQTVKVCVTSVDKDKQKMRLKIVTDEEEEQQSVDLSIGEYVSGIVTESSRKGIYMLIQKKDSENSVTGFLPAGHLAPCIDIGNILASCYRPGKVISAFVFATKPTLLMSRTFVTQEKYRNFDSLKVGDCVPCTIREIADDGVKVIVPCENYSKLTFIPHRDMCALMDAHVYQILFAKIIAINKRERELTLTTTLKAAWESLADFDYKVMMGMDLLNLYFKRIADLQKFCKNTPIGSLALGQKVDATVEKILENGILMLRLNDYNDLTGVVRREHHNDDLAEGSTVSGIILWKDYAYNFVEMSLLPRVINSISPKQHLLPNLKVATRERAEILLITNWFALVVVKHEGKGYLAAIPVRRHKNDTAPDLTLYKIHAELRVYIVFDRDECDIIPTCMIQALFSKIPGYEARWGSAESEKSPTENKQELKRKRVSESNDVDLANPPKKASKEVPKKVSKEVPKKASKKASKEVPKKALEKENEKKSEVKDKESGIKDTDEYSESDEEETEEEQSAGKLCVPECGFLWDDKAKTDTSSNTETSDTDWSDAEWTEDEEENLKQKNKKNLSAAELREQMLQEERKFRETEILRRRHISVDEFEKLILENPSNSLVWVRYMIHHVQTADIEKSRAVAKRALKSIDVRQETAVLSIWETWLNLESKFGTAESLDHVFQEALKANDEYKIYMHVLKLHAKDGRNTEFEKMLDKVLRKFKKGSQTWIDCGAALLRKRMKEKSRQIMQRALQSLPKSEHVNLLVKFANLENKMGDKKRAYMLFETVLSSYPKRVDVWSNYVDCLIKFKKIDLARKVLKRACVQTLPPRKMKTLFTKFINFEEKYGTSEDVARVRQMVTEYVDKRTK